MQESHLRQGPFLVPSCGHERASPGSEKSREGARGRRHERALPSTWLQVQESWSWKKPFLVAGEAEASVWGERLQWWLCPLHIT